MEEHFAIPGSKVLSVGGSSLCSKKLAKLSSSADTSCRIICCIIALYLLSYDSVKLDPNLVTFDLFTNLIYKNIMDAE